MNTSTRAASSASARWMRETRSRTSSGPRGSWAGGNFRRTERRLPVARQASRRRGQPLSARPELPAAAQRRGHRLGWVRSCDPRRALELDRAWSVFRSCGIGTRSRLRWRMFLSANRRPLRPGTCARRLPPHASVFRGQRPLCVKIVQVRCRRASSRQRRMETRRAGSVGDSINQNQPVARDRLRSRLRQRPGHAARAAAPIA